ncbi:MAG: NAD-dependent epimerase/dehydratase family protein, partial [Gemmatimonadales bacterium]
MKAFVTGGTGFIGGHLVDTLVSRGDEVTALVRDPRKAQDIARRGARLAVGDLSHPDLAAHLEGQDVVYHLAGLVAARSEAEFLATNRDGTEALVQAA